MVDSGLPEIISFDEARLFAPSGKSMISGYAVYSYMRVAGKKPGVYIFNNSRSAQPFSGFDIPLPDYWDFALNEIMKNAEEDDAKVIEHASPSEYLKELIFGNTEYKFLISKFPFIMANNEVVIFSSIRNVTVFVDSLNKIGSRNVLFSLVAENMSDVFCVFDLEARLAFMSASVKKLTGYSAGEIAEIPLSQLLTAESFETLMNLWQEFKNSAVEQVPFQPEFKQKLVEIEFIRKDQEKRWAELTAASFADPEGCILGVHGLIRDITERKAGQEEIRSSLKREIELSNVKSKYISTISHEFRTPLSIIYSNLQLLENHRFELDAETINDAFELSRMAVKSLLRVLDKVTVIDAVNKGKLEYKPAASNLEKLCHKLVNDLNEMEMVPGRIDLIIGDLPAELWIDESLFNHIFTNLLLNALNFSEKKFKVKFEVSMVTPDLAGFIISDQGMGIPEAEKGYIFEPFFRTSNARHARGSGLGLAVVRDCLKLNKGEISFESEIGVGSVFKVLLPVAQEDGVID